MMAASDDALVVRKNVRPGENNVSYPVVLCGYAMADPGRTTSLIPWSSWLKKRDRGIPGRSAECDDSTRSHRVLAAQSGSTQSGRLPLVGENEVSYSLFESPRCSSSSAMLVQCRVDRRPATMLGSISF